MRIPINLASEPFQRHRPMLVASGATALLLVASLVFFIYLAAVESRRSADTREAVSALQARTQALAAEQAKLEATLREPENAEILEHSLFYNSLLYRKGISWTRIFDDLEKVLPYNVRLISIRPQVNTKNEVLLDMVLGSATSEPVVNMLSRLEASPQFGATYVHNRLPPSQSEPLLRYRVTVNYAQNFDAESGGGPVANEVSSTETQENRRASISGNSQRPGNPQRR